MQHPRVISICDTQYRSLETEVKESIFDLKIQMILFFLVFVYGYTLEVGYGH